MYQRCDLTQLTYAPLDLATHPIDTSNGPNGWGPMGGPYTPFDYPSPATSLFGDGINTTWFQGDNQWQVAPPYATKTIFMDASQALVNNSHVAPTLLPKRVSYATINNVGDPTSAGLAAAQPKTSVIKQGLMTILGLK